MVKHNTNISKILCAYILAVAAPLSALLFVNPPVKAAYSACASGNTNCDDQDINFEVNVNESLGLSVEVPQNWATGAVDTLLRNKITFGISANTANGFTASMYADNSSYVIADATPADTASTALVNIDKASAIINTLAAPTTASAFDANRWGFSLNDTDEGNTSANYAGIGTASVPSKIASSNKAASTTQAVYFGAKTSAASDSGTYASTIVISLVSGVIDDNTNPVTPDNPAKPSDTTPTNPVYDETHDRTVYTHTYTTTAPTNPTSSVTGSTTTTIIETASGDVRTAYANPAGVTTAKIGEGTPLATGLAVTAGIAAASGIVFFIIAKRKRDDDEED